MTDYFRIVNTTLDDTLDSTRPLAGIRPENLDDVAKIAGRLVPHVAQWAGKYPLMGGVGDAGSRIVFACLSSATAFPHRSLDELVDWSALALTLFALDDVMDGVVLDYSLEQLVQFTEMCLAVGKGNAPTPADRVSDPEAQVLAALRECSGRFAKYPAYAKLQGYVTERWNRCFTAMCQESRWRLHGEPPPTLDDYLANAVWSFFVPLYFAVATTTLDPDDLSEDALGTWDKVMHVGSRAMRLCNDLRSAERERAEGSLNALALLTRSGHTEPDAIAAILAEVHESLAELDARIAELQPSLARIAGALLRTTHFYCSWCLARDTHGLTIGLFRQLLASHKENR
ncbi:terpene synthase family protein [Kibdelosporangium aridum]|uniref:terpene synthase family protein n=1 Tax=Kibdelosporangium aridum TaxID=2030 RepID=UPI0005258891